MQKMIHSRGVTVVEVLIGTAIFTIMTAAVAGVMATYFSTAADTVAQTKAVYLLREGHELVRFARDEAWADVSTESVDTPRYLDLSAADVAFSGSVETIDSEYTRTIYFRDAYRNADNDLVASTTAGASADPGSRLVDVVVSWDTQSIRTQSLLTNIFNQ